MKRVLSGIRASGNLHLGNYLGAVKGMLTLQNSTEHETFYMVADLHSVTTPFSPSELRISRREVILDYLAAGLDPEKSAIFLQSQVADLHCEFMFYLSTVINVARMKHLPTYKEKVKQYPRNVTMALLNYPVLMTSDILIYKAHAVPVGIDQEPHLEVAREIARKLNKKFNLSFPEPVRFSTKGEYVPSLKGEGKMSKSVQGSYIKLTDDLETIRKKIAIVPTDLGKGEKIPQNGGVNALLTLVELFQGKQKRSEYESQYITTGIRYAKLKAELAETIYHELKPLQEKRKQYERNHKTIDKILQQGAQKARKSALKTLKELKTAFGFN